MYYAWYALIITTNFAKMMKWFPFKSDHAYLQAKPLDLSKLIYCSRTVPELEKVNKQVSFFGNIFTN